jgi:hypothetical protein
MGLKLDLSPYWKPAKPNALEYKELRGDVLIEGR